jgi:hypothetical protein
MGDGDSKPFSIDRCREMLGTEYSRLSDEEIEALRVQTDAWGLRGFGNVVDQNSASWNRISGWLRQLHLVRSCA